MKGEVVDLDILRPGPKIVKLAGEEIDVSFIPCGITFDVDRLVTELFTMDTEKVKEGGEETNRAFDLTMELCASFCTVEHPHMTKEWFLKNTDPGQVNKLAELIRETLLRSYEGAEAYQGN